MAIIPGQPVTAAVVNAEFASKVDNTSFAGIVSFNNVTESTDKDTGGAVFNGGIGVEKNLNIGGTVAVGGNVNSTDKDTGALVIQAGGLGVEQDINAGGTIAGSNLSGTNTGDQDLSPYQLLSDKGATNGYAPLVGGLIPIVHIPVAAIERIYVVANQTARFALTTLDVQNGDTVKQVDINEMFYVIDENNLGNASGYESYAAGTATSALSVPWSGVTGIDAQVSDLAGLSYSGNAGKVIKVNPGETSWILSDDTVQSVETRVITSGESAAKQLALASTPIFPGKTILEIQDAPAQYYGDDFVVSGANLSWSGLGLDGILTTGDKLTIIYN